MRRSPLLPIFLIVLVDVLALTILIPLLPFYATRYGASDFTVGLLLASFAGCQLISGPILGSLSDRFGRRPMLLISQVGTCAGLLLLGSTESLPLIFLARMIDGATAGNLSIAQAYVSDVTTPDRRARAFGLIGIAFGVGFTIGPAVSALFASIHTPIFIAAGLSATSILATFFLLPSQPPRPVEEDGAPPPPAGRRLGLLEWKGYLEYFRRPSLAPLLAQFALFMMSFVLFVSAFALFCAHRFTWHGVPFTQRQVGWLFGYFGVLGIILQGGLLGRLVARFGERKLVMFGFLCAAIGYMGLAGTHTLAPLLVVAAIGAVGSGLLRPALTSEITRAVGRSEQGVVLGLTQSITSVTQIVAPPVATALIGANWLSTWALLTGTVASIGLAVAISKRTPPVASEPAAT